MDSFLSLIFAFFSSFILINSWLFLSNGALTPSIRKAKGSADFRTPVPTLKVSSFTKKLELPLSLGLRPRSKKLSARFQNPLEEKRKNFQSTQMAALVVLKPFRICLKRPLKNRKGKFEYRFTIAIKHKKSRKKKL